MITVIRRFFDWYQRKYITIIVFGLNKSGVVFTKGQKQAANVVLSVLLAGVSLLDPAFQDVIAASLASLGPVS